MHLHTVAYIVAKLRAECEDVPDNAKEEVQEFIQQLLDKGNAGYQKQL